MILIFYFSFFLSGSHFPSKEDEDSGYFFENNLGFHQEIPNYIYDAIKYINQDKEFGRVLMLPEYNTHVYDWGYSSTGDISAELLKKGVLWPIYSEGFTNNYDHSIFVKDIYKQIYNGILEKNFNKLINILAIKYFIIRNDFNYKFFDSHIINENEFIEKNLDNLNLHSEKIIFGDWTIYKLEQNHEIFSLENLNTTLQIDSKNYPDLILLDMYKYKNTENIMTEEIYYFMDDLSYCLKNKINYKKLDYSLYKINLSNECNEKSYLLKFNMSYNNLWVIYDGNKLIFPKKINFYQNIFKLNDIKDNENVYLIFLPTYINLFFLIIILLSSILMFMRIKK